MLYKKGKKMFYHLFLGHIIFYLFNSPNGIKQGEYNCRKPCEHSQASPGMVQANTDFSYCGMLTVTAESTNFTGCSPIYKSLYKNRCPS